MGLRRGGNDNPLYIFPVQHFLVLRTDRHGRILGLKLIKRIRIRITNDFQRPNIIVIAHKVFTPVAGADNGNGRKRLGE